MRPTARRSIDRRTGAVQALVAALALSGCGGAPGGEPDGPEPVGEAIQAETVAEAVQNGCSTASVKALAQQVVEQADCATPGAYVAVPAQPNVDFGAAVFAYLEQPARDAFVAAAKKHPGTTMTVNSMLRTVVQQYMLYRWYQNQQCGIGLAAKPGNSNHETGLALDVSEHGTWQAALEAEGFQWYGGADPVHFDYAGPDAVVHKGTDVLAFQQLWNSNNPGDPIDEDGVYGPQTQARIEKSPAGGFAKGANCGGPPPAGAPDVWPSLSLLDAKDFFGDHGSKGVPDAFEGEVHHAALSVLNQGDSAAKVVNVGVSVGSPWIASIDYLVESDWQHPGTFTENDASSSPDNPPHGTPPGSSFTLKLGQLSPGETKRVTLTFSAAQYSIGLSAAPEVRFWVADVDDRYHQAGFGDAPTNDGSQTSGGGVLEARGALDVYSHTRWEWDGGVLEGFTAEGGATLTPDAQGKVLVLDADAPGPAAIGPDTSFPAAARPFVSLRARRSGGTGASRLDFATDASPTMGEDKVIPLDVPADGQFHELVVDASAVAGWTGTITKLRFRPFDSGPGKVELDYLRVGDDATSGGGGAGGAPGEGGEGGAAPEGDPSSGLSGHGADEAPADPGGGCGCALPGSRQASSSSLVAVLTCLLFGVGVRRRASSARRADAGARRPRSPRRPDGRTLDACDD